ncbi:MAG: TatD family hydrolase [Candidatus Rokuibacteriota bacterium]
MIIDSHCHLHDAAFSDVRETLKKALAHGVWGVVAVGCDLETNERTLAAAASLPKGVWAALGFHPDRPQLTDVDLDRLEDQLRAHHARTVALGEIGLPWYCLQTVSDPVAVMSQARQRFERLLDLAVRYDLPVALHAPHGAAAPALDALKRRGIERAVFHWHKAPLEVTRAIVDAGYFVSVGPEVVYRDRDRDLVTAVPLEALLVESDAPWQYQGEFAGLPSGPWFAGRVAEEVAKIKQLPVEDAISHLSSNACDLFDLPWN